MAYAALRRVATPRRPPRLRHKPFLAPTRGWVSATNLAAAPAGAAQVLENWYPTTTGIKMRSGCQKHGTASASGEPTESLMAYIGGPSTRAVFAGVDGNIIEMTSPADEDTEPTAAVTGQASNYYSSVNFTTSGGSFMPVANGTDNMLIYDGTAFYPADDTVLYAIDFDAQTGAFTEGLTLTGGTSGATGAIVKVIDDGTTGTLWINDVSGTFQDNETITDSSTGSATEDGTATLLIGSITGVTTSSIEHVNVYRNRLWLTDGSLSAYYLPTDSITGSASEVALAGVFKNGGALLFTATWSYDAGDGMDDRIVFVTTEGEAAVYQGDPSDTTNWGLVGRYDCAPPLGKKAYLTVGGDLLILTEIGLVPMSAIVSKDPGALALAAVSRNIQPDWIKEARQRRNLPWEIVKWTSRSIAYVTCPVTADDSITPPICFAVNLETGAWSKVTGWNTRCMALHDDNVYFGTNDGLLMQADVTGADDGEIIYYTYVGHMDHLGNIGGYKTVVQARAIFRALNDFNPTLSVTTDYSVELPTYPDAALPVAVSLWDVGIWDEAVWDAGENYYTAQTQWVSVGESGFAHAPILLVTSGSAAAPSAELVTFDVTYEAGGLVV